MAVQMTKVNWIDNSAIQQTQNIPELDTRPLFFVVSSFDKGTEDLNVISGTDFYNMYGTPLFTRHGQNGIQAQRLINAGAKLLVKRVCADNATLANLVIYATVTTTDVQKTDNEGHPIYLDDNGNETTEVTDNPVLVSTTKIKWNATSFTNCTTYDQVRKAAIEQLFDQSAGKFPVFIYTDNGRGASSKAVRITPNYYTSRNLGFCIYSLKVYEGTTVDENVSVSFNPDKTFNNINYGIDNSTCYQVKAEVIPEVYSSYIDALSAGTGIDPDTLYNYDMIFGFDYKGNTIEGLSLDAESVDLNALNGISLAQGTNGAFGTAPVNTEAWTEKIRQVFAGEATEEVWDVDKYKIAAVLDANFPQTIKDAISNFVTWREDCVFLRDLGTGNYTFSDIREAYARNTTKNKFIADYSTTYTIKDPNTKKNIEVTMLYDMAACLVRGFNNGIVNPLAGTYNGYILDSAIEGTINFTPIITPAVNQKEAFEDLRLNYAIFQEGSGCVVQSEYTSQEAYTELSYLNNVLAIQEVVRALRTSCPANRYRLVSGTDLTDYAIDCNKVLERFLSNFYVLEFTYTEDPMLSMQKIFYASIKFAFNQFANCEIFDVYALNTANLMAES